MGMHQKNLDIVFRCIQPEVLFKNIVREEGWNAEPMGISASHISLDIFQSLAHVHYPSHSFEEIENMHCLMTAAMEPAFPNIMANTSVFYLLTRMGERVFRQTGDTIVCSFSQLLAWQNVYQRLGQDIFTTAFFACMDLCHGCPARSDFTWSPILKTDNVQLNALLRQGIAENHCHLGGTSQNFALSWACVMNYPDTILTAAKQLKQNLQANLSRGSSDNVWPWEYRLQWAAYLRVELFKRLEVIGFQRPIRAMEWNCFCPLHWLKRELEYVKACFGARIPQKSGGDFVLDYALRIDDCKDGLVERHNRLLSGERSFLYRCFRACFDGTFDESCQNWFYLYLLLKENFRAEVIQVNRQAGFRNFKDYQDRKDMVYDGLAGYQAESVRLAINEKQENQNIVSFEARIAPKDSVNAIYSQIRNYEEQIRYAKKGEDEYCHFYVYHFIKSPDSAKMQGNKYLVHPRNFDVRRSSERKAKALGCALQRSDWLCQRVRGIDAANTEIYCRPETFATEFRYLRNLQAVQAVRGFFDSDVKPGLRVTYHVGEDFLDIADGLRAIDEAVKFLHLERGDRIGHGLALGIDPAWHYKVKHGKVVLPKQDLLDNVVWLLYRAQELGVSINPKLRSVLQTQADCCLSEVYGNCLRDRQISCGLYDYYCSMQLRGDAPDLYYVMGDLAETSSPFLYASYDFFKRDYGEKLDVYRRSQNIFGLCQCYHFEREVREKGRATEEFSISDDYVDLVREMQDKLAGELMRKGIMIECNLTSNYLIGTFRRYDAHPILRFNNMGLLRNDGVYEPCAQVSVSINTDDAGVFDTSLENEYALLAASLEQAFIGENRKYNRDSIYAYLENIRKMGFEQAFFDIGRKDAFRDGW